MLFPNARLGCLEEQSYEINYEKSWLTTTTRGEPYIATEATSPTLPTNILR